MKKAFSHLIIMLCLICASVFYNHNIQAATPIFELIIKDHLFFPSEFTIPAGVKIKLVIYNKDITPEEFESYELNREKIIMGSSKAIVFIGPLKAGKYPFFGEFNIKTAQGVILVTDQIKEPGN